MAKKSVGRPKKYVKAGGAVHVTVRLPRDLVDEGQEYRYDGNKGGLGEYITYLYRLYKKGFKNER